MGGVKIQKFLLIDVYTHTYRKIEREGPTKNLITRTHTPITHIFKKKEAGYSSAFLLVEASRYKHAPHSPRSVRGSELGVVKQLPQLHSWP